MYLLHVSVFRYHSVSWCFRISSTTSWPMGVSFTKQCCPIRSLVSSVSIVGRRRRALRVELPPCHKVSASTFYRLLYPNSYIKQHKPIFVKQSFNFDYKENLKSLHGFVNDTVIMAYFLVPSQIIQDSLDQCPMPIDADHYRSKS